jgi:diguanylate cyclase (GGDEF)-like protein
MCDVDGLKLVNDILGHDRGDDLLVAAAGILKRCFREGDVIARLGGDEFAMLLPNSSGPVIENICRRIKDAVAVYNRSNPSIPLSISIGFATRNDPATPIGDILKEADNNMYREKLYHSQSARSAIIHTLIKALEARDFIPQGHVHRLQDLMAGMAAAVSLSERTIADLRLFAQFHDIGKVGIPDRILFKEGPLTPEEKAEIQRHSEIGYRIAQSAADLLPIAELVLKHHEWWNGEGYPLGLKGEEIPIECRIFSIADAYDAMTNDRPYRKALSRPEAVAELRRCSGTRFDPDLIPVFIKMIDGV